MPSFSARFRERVEVWRNTSTKSDPDPSDFTKDDGPNIPAEIIDVKGGETIRGRTIEAYMNALITVRYCSGMNTLKPKDKLIGTAAPYSGVTFNIVGVAVKRQQGRPMLLEFDCTRNG